MYRWGMIALILFAASWASVIILALYEWKFLVAGLLVLVALIAWPEGPGGRYHWRNILPPPRK